MARASRGVRKTAYVPSRYYGYEDGSAVRKPEWLPDRREEQAPDKQKQAAPKKRANQRLRQNRARAQSIGPGYIAFLCLVCFLSLYICVNYLQLRSRLTTQSGQIAALETNLTRLRADNDAYYKQTLADVSIEEVRDVAVNRLGMHYPSESQIVYYSADGNAYVRQYREVPHSK